MKRLSRPVGVAVLGCALAASGVSAYAAKSPVIGATDPGAAPNDKAPAQTVAAAGAKAPRGWVIVTHSGISAPSGTQTRGSVACPAGTVPFGGGAVISGSSLNENLNSSFPSGTSWFADVNNVAGVTGTFSVYAVCAKAPRKYTIVESSAFTAPVDGQASGTVSCPANTVVLGGGSLSNSGSVAVNINSTIPTSTGWRADQNNNTTPASTFEVLAVCGKKPRNWQIVSGSPVTNPPSSQNPASVACPTGTVPLGGGGFSSSGSAAVDLNSTLPLSSGWQVYEDNTAGAGTATITAITVCAS